jgi:hypothetical protein
MMHVPAGSIVISPDLVTLPIPPMGGIALATEDGKALATEDGNALEVE